MLGRYPYAGPGLDERTTLVPPTEQHCERYGRALLSVLYEGVAYDPSRRPNSAAVFADRVQSARDMPLAPGQRSVNPTVAALRGLYRKSGVGNAGNRGMDDAFARETYAPTRLDTELLPAIVDRALEVVVLSGNPGDGKTSFLVRVGDALDAVGAVTVHTDAAGWRSDSTATPSSRSTTLPSPTAASRRTSCCGPRSIRKRVRTSAGARS